MEPQNVMCDCFKVSVQRLAPEATPVPADILAEIKELFRRRYPAVLPADGDYEERVKDVVLVYGAGVGRRVPPWGRGWQGCWPAALEALLKPILRWMSLANAWLLCDAKIAGGCHLKLSLGSESQREVAEDIRAELLGQSAYCGTGSGRTTVTNLARQLARLEKQVSLSAWLGETNRLPLSIYVARAVKGALRRTAAGQTEESGLSWLFAPGAFLQGRYGMHLAQNHGLKLVNVLVWKCPRHPEFKNLAYLGATCVKCGAEASEHPGRYDPALDQHFLTQWLMFFTPDGSAPPGWSLWPCWRCQDCDDVYPKADEMCRNRHRRRAGAGVTTAVVATGPSETSDHGTKATPVWATAAWNSVQEALTDLTKVELMILECVVFRVPVKQAVIELGISEEECRQRYEEMKTWLRKWGPGR